MGLGWLGLALLLHFFILLFLKAMATTFFNEWSGGLALDGVFLGRFGRLYSAVSWQWAVYVGITLR
jgi:hypothetical protein